MPNPSILRAAVCMDFLGEFFPCCMLLPYLSAHESLALFPRHVELVREIDTFRSDFTQIG